MPPPVYTPEPKYGDLDEALVVADDDIFVIEAGGITYRVRLTTLKDYINA